MAIARTRWLPICLLGLSTGCMGAAGLQDWSYNRANRSRAAKSYRESYSAEQRHSLSRDFEDGFKKGYFDLATGRDCKVPPVAPPKYWSASYQSCETRGQVEDWFRGYQCGVASAQKCGLGEFNNVPVSACAPTVNCNANGACYSPDACQDDCAPCGQDVTPPVHFEPSPGLPVAPAMQVDPGLPVVPVAPSSHTQTPALPNIFGPIDVIEASAQ